MTGAGGGTAAGLGAGNREEEIFPPICVLRGATVGCTVCAASSSDHSSEGRQVGWSTTADSTTLDASEAEVAVGLAGATGTRPALALPSEMEGSWYAFLATVGGNGGDGGDADEEQTD